MVHGGLGWSEILIILKYDLNCLLFFELLSHPNETFGFISEEFQRKTPLGNELISVLYKPNIFVCIYDICTCQEDRFQYTTEQSIQTFKCIKKKLAFVK